MAGGKDKWHVYGGGHPINFPELPLLVIIAPAMIVPVTGGWKNVIFFSSSVLLVFRLLLFVVGFKIISCPRGYIEGGKQHYHQFHGFHHYSLFFQHF